MIFHHFPNKHKQVSIPLYITRKVKENFKYPTCSIPHEKSVEDQWHDGNSTRRHNAYKKNATFFHDMVERREC